MNRNSSNDALRLNTYTYIPSRAAIMQSGNLYAYCISNPLMFVDPSGDIIIFWIIIGAIVGFVVGSGFDMYQQLEDGTRLKNLDLTSILISALWGLYRGR